MSVVAVFRAPGGGQAKHIYVCSFVHLEIIFFCCRYSSDTTVNHLIFDPRSARSVHAVVIIFVWVQTFFINSNPVSSLDPAAIVPLNSILKLLSNYVPETRMVYRALWRRERFCFSIKAWQNHYTCKAVHCCRLKIQMDVVVSSDGLGIIAPTVSKKSVGLVRVKMWADCNKVTILLYS